MGSSCFIVLLFVTQQPFDRIGPPISDLVNGKIDAAALAPLALLNIDDESLSPHYPDFACRNPGILRSRQNRLCRMRVRREDDSRLAFTEQEGIATQRIERQFYHSPSFLARCGHAAFSQGHSQPAIRTIMRRLNQSFLNRFQYKVLYGLLGFGVQKWWRTLLPVVEHFQILTPSQIISGLPEQHNDIAVVPKPLSHGSISLLDQTDHTQHRRGIDRESVGLIIETDVSAHDWNVEVFARVLHALDGQHKLPHNNRPLGVTEIQTVGQSDGLCT